MAIFSLVFGTVLAGAATADSEQVLRERVQARWEALIQRDFDTAYRFETPAYRALYTEQDYRDGFGTGVIWQQATVDQLTIEADDTATVHVQIEYTIPEYDARGLPGIASWVTERWLRVDGEWWHVPEPR